MSEETTEASDDPTLVTIGDLQLRRALRYERDRAKACLHRRLEMDPVGETVVCEDCHTQVTAWWALDSLRQRFRDAWDAVRAERDRARWERQKTVHTAAARKVEEAWRRKMAPCCPHCQHAILPEDGLGGSQVNLAGERARRKEGANDG